MSNFFLNIFHRKKRILPHFERVKLDKKKLLLNNLLGGVAWGVGSVTGATMILVIIGLFITLTRSIPFIGDIVRISISQIEDARDSAAFLTDSSSSGSSFDESEETLRFLLEAKKNTYKLTEYVEISGAVYNVSFENELTFFDSCAENLEILVDGESKFKSNSQCEIEPGTIEPFGNSAREFYLDASKLSLGAHEIIFVSDTLISNTITITLVEPTERIDCVSYTDSISPVCTQITVQSNSPNTSIERGGICSRLSRALQEQSEILAVDGYSSFDCEKSDQVTAVFNVPKNEGTQWQQYLQQVTAGIPTSIQVELPDVYRLVESDPIN